jgi:hypothetical protein
MKRQCPNCGVTMTRFQWSKLWWMSSVLTGRMVKPCEECGTLLRLSAMTLLTSVGALALIATSYLIWREDTVVLRIVALACAVLMLVGVLGSRVEVAPTPTVQGKSAAL